MDITEFIINKRNAYLQNKKDEIEGLKMKLKRANVYNEHIEWDEIDDDMKRIKDFTELQTLLDSDWNTWVLDDSEFIKSSDEEKEKIREHEIFLHTPINGWNLYDQICKEIEDVGDEELKQYCTELSENDQINVVGHWCELSEKFNEIVEYIGCIDTYDYAETDEERENSGILYLWKIIVSKDHPLAKELDTTYVCAWCE